MPPVSFVENIVRPLKDELNATREELQATKKEMASTKRTMSRLAKAVEAVNDCRHVDDCPVRRKLRLNQEIGTGDNLDSADNRNRDTTTAVIKEIRWESVPRSEVTLRLSVDSLHKLPAEASYSKRSGRAQVEVRARGDTVYITGSCDSLQRWVEYYAALYHSARDALEEQEAHYEQESKERGMPIKAAIAIFAAA